MFSVIDLPGELAAQRRAGCVGCRRYPARNCACCGRAAAIVTQASDECTCSYCSRCWAAVKTERPSSADPLPAWPIGDYLRRIARPHR